MEYDSLYEYLHKEMESVNNIYLLPRDELCRLFNCYWKGSISSFAKTYGLNRQKVSRFLKDEKRKTTDCVKAFQKWLVNSYYTEEIISKPLKEFVPPLSKDLQAIIFVNGDDALYQVLNTEWLLSKDLPVKFIITTSYNKKESSITFLEKAIVNYPHLFELYYSPSVKGVVDIAIVTQVARCYDLPKEVSFWLVTSDLYAAPVIDDLIADGRVNSQLIDYRTDDLGIALLLANFEIPLSREAYYLKDSINNNSSLAIPNFACHLTDNSLKKILDRYSTPSDYSKESYYEERGEMSEENLRILFRKHWSYTIKSFCRIYHLNQGNFTAWLQRRKPIYPGIEKAIHKLISEPPQNQETCI